MVFSMKSLATATTIFSIAQGAVLGKRALTGQATTYGGNTAGGTCSFSTYTLPASLFGTALSDSNWDNAANCGRCVSVTGPSGNSITAMITDECPGCGVNHLDLYPTAFTSLAPLSEGIINVAWSYVDCPITTPLELHNKEGVSANWFSMQVVNAKEGVTKLEVSKDGGVTWGSTTRQTYNFFEYAPGYGSTVDVRVTGVSGSVVTVKNVAVTPGSVVTASSNFGSSGSGAAASPVTKEVSTSSAQAAASSASSVAPVEPSTTAVQATSTEAPVVEPTASSSSSVIATSAAAPVITSAASSVSVPSSSSLSWAPKSTQSVVYVYEDGDECDA
ncbi:extracellular cellulase allergen asp f7 protein [Rutstroemia sp. NJR-2017a WRK4]|nr:extracellular cellulase allergen asp f7 protein [Rutstroemia sp. NJR-2017a WRK4]